MWVIPLVGIGVGSLLRRCRLDFECYGVIVWVVEPEDLRDFVGEGA